MFKEFLKCLGAVLALKGIIIIISKKELKVVLDTSHLLNPSDFV